MGRPLKIKKSTATDIGYPNFGSLTNATYPGTLTSSNFLGVVGGAPVLSTPTAAYPVLTCQVNIALPSGAGQGVYDGRIIVQKGASKYLVTSNGQNVQDENMVVGATYMIGSIGGTDFAQMGAPAGYQVGTIFTCTAQVASPQNGYGWLVGICVLSNSASPTAGNMSIGMSVNGDSTQIYISRLTNKWALDYANNRYLINFFSDEGTEIKSGTADDNIGLAQAESITS
jgi:hypothetical protein